MPDQVRHDGKGLSSRNAPIRDLALPAFPLLAKFSDYACNDRIYELICFPFYTNLDIDITELDQPI